MAKNKWYVWEDKQGVHVDGEPCKGSPVREAIITDRAPAWAQEAFESHQKMMRQHARIKLVHAQTIIETKTNRSLDEVVLYAKIEAHLRGFDARARIVEMSNRFSADHIFKTIFAPRLEVI